MRYFKNNFFCQEERERERLRQMERKLREEERRRQREQLRERQRQREVHRKQRDEAIKLARERERLRYCNRQMSRLVGKPTMWFPNRSDTNRAVEAQKRARSLKFRFSVEEELYYPSSENKGTDQLRSYREADLRLCFRYADCWFSHEAAQIFITTALSVSFVLIWAIAW